MCVVQLEFISLKGKISRILKSCYPKNWHEQKRILWGYHHSVDFTGGIKDVLNNIKKTTARLVKRDIPNGRVALPNRMNFWKNSKRPLTPPPHFWKIILQFFMTDMVAYMRGGMMAIYYRDSEVPSSKCVLFSCFLIQLLKKTYPEPWNYYFLSRTPSIVQKKWWH